MLGPDEPRYASIGRDMARSGDWVTPRLWGKPWFEKPALLYWMTGTAYLMGLPDDLAPRLPVAAMAVGFLVFFWRELRREYGERVAWYAGTILGTSAGWLAFGHVATTDMPLSACFGGAMLLVLRQFSQPRKRTAVVAGILLGLAVLAKGLVPFILFLPAIWFLRRQPVLVAITLAAGLVVAAPWYTLVTVRNGMPFIDEFIIKHHFARFTTASLQHVQKWWFYIPVLLGSLFPWTPSLLLLFRRGLYTRSQERFLLAWAVLGLAFFSASQNKLPSYLLPMLPPLAALLGLGLAQARTAKWILAATGALICTVPVITYLLPDALVRGITKASVHFQTGFVPIAILLGLLLWLLAGQRRPDWAMAALAVLMVISVINLVWNTYPILDTVYSARGLWRSAGFAGCADDLPRSKWYGLNYYARKSVPDCIQSP